MKKFLIIALPILVVGLGLFLGIRFWYPFGEGIKTGELNYVVNKGLIFKTWEGKLIQSGFRTTSRSGISSNEFVFSIDQRTLADTLMRLGGHVVELHYKEYFGTLPWRGYSKYVVDGLLSASPSRIYPQTPYLPPVAE